MARPLWEESLNRLLALVSSRRAILVASVIVLMLSSSPASGAGCSKAHGFLRDATGVFTTLDVPGALYTFAFGINGNGEIVGAYLDGVATHGFVRDVTGAYTTVDVPGSLRTEVHGIADDGRIVGLYDDVNNVIHGFVGTPVLIVAQQMKQLIAPLKLPAGLATSLDAKLEQAAEALTEEGAPNVRSACGRLRAFLNEVHAQTGKKLSDAQMTALITACDSIRATIGCL